jgi:transposase
MALATNAHQKLSALFAKQPCWTIDPLAEQLDYSIPSVRRFLAKVGYYSSFTHNGRWYTLAAIPRFGRLGLWFYKDIGFSRAGSLTDTLVMLVSASASGMRAEPLGQTLRCRCHSVLVALVRQGRLQRQKLGRSFVYLAADDKTAGAQSRAIQKTDRVQLPAEMAVLVLVEFIRRPDAGFGQLAKAVSRSTGVRIDAGHVQALFERHGLKKTA